MNKNNFKKLIDAILFDGQFRFNMSCFIGKLSLPPERYQQAIKENGELASDYVTNSLHRVETTDLFNCDSVGCIAGFATALSNEWKTPEWLKPQPENEHFNENSSVYGIVQDFEATANKFLGLTSGQGKKLYYADSDSLWKYLRYYEDDRYPNLEYVGEEEFEAEEIVDHDCDWNDDSYEISFNSIDYKTAANVLTRIMNEEIVLGEGYGEIEINNPALVGDKNESI
jgi:hypothetical protein